MHHYHHGHGGGYYGGGGYYSGGRLAGAIIAFIAVVFIVIVIGVVASAGGTSGVSKSTLERTAIQPAGPFSRDCIDDRADWITDRNKLLSGMEDFYKKTGVQPAICITDSLGGDDPEFYATARYDDLIGHEKGILLLFYEPAPSDWDAYYMAGKAAQTVMDSEACDILMDYVEAYYTSDMTEEEYFSAVFAETGDRIMTVTPTVASKIPVIVAGVVAAAAVFGIVKAIQLKHRRERERAEETERILKTPVDRL